MRVGEQKLLPQADVAVMLGCTVRTLENWRARRTGPPFIRLGNRVVYREAALEQWLVQQEETPVRS